MDGTLCVDIDLGSWDLKSVMLPDWAESNHQTEQGSASAPSDSERQRIKAKKGENLLAYSFFDI